MEAIRDPLRASAVVVLAAALALCGFLITFPIRPRGRMVQEKDEDSEERLELWQESALTVCDQAVQGKVEAKRRLI
jgi:hypothetical protein